MNVASRRGDHIVAMKQHGHANADGEAAHRGDKRFFVVRQYFEKIERVRTKAAALRRLHEFTDIRAGRKHTVAAGDQHAADGLVRPAHHAAPA